METRWEGPRCTAIRGSDGEWAPNFATPLQIRRVLRKHPKAAQIRTFFQGLTADEKEDWQFATQVSRNNPLILKMQVALSATEQQIDNLFRAAADEGSE